MLPEIYVLEDKTNRVFTFYKFRKHDQMLVKIKLTSIYNYDNSPNEIHFFEGAELFLSGIYNITYITPLINELNCNKYFKIRNANYAKLPNYKYKKLLSYEDNYYTLNSDNSPIITFIRQLYNTNFDINNNILEKNEDSNIIICYSNIRTNNYIRLTNYIHYDIFYTTLLAVLKILYKKQYKKVDRLLLD